MDGFGYFFRHWFGAIDGSHITSAQMATRAVVVYVAVIVIVRLGKKRFLGKGSAFDIILGVMLGAVAGRAISGGAPVVPSLAACAALVALHWLFSLAALKSHTLGSIIKGHSRVIVRDGNIDEQAMRHSHLSIHDLEEELRQHNVASLAKVAEARLERSGHISILTKGT
jgi:uncharacterized membrane protein YcaP (DUF421 family)